MEFVGKKIESQVQFWSFLGPFFVLLSITTLLFKVSPHWYFPLSALIGIPLCVKWKMKGLAAALGCLFLMSGLSYHQLDFDELYWHVGLSLAMAFSFIVLTLSFEEGQGLIAKLLIESQSRLDNFLLLDEKLKAAENEWNVEKEKLKRDCLLLTQEIAGLQDEKQTFYKLAQLTKDELLQVRGQHDLLLQDLQYKKQQIFQLNERLEETELTIQEFVNSDAEQKILALTSTLSTLEAERELFKAKLTLLSNEFEEKKGLINNLQGQNIELMQINTDLTHEKESLQKDKDKEFDEKGILIQELRQQIESNKEAIEILHQEKETLLKKQLQQELNYQEFTERKEIEKHKEEKTDSSMTFSNGRTIEAMYLQLKDQFQEKSEILNETRRQLFAANEELLRRQKEYEEENVYDLPSTIKALQEHIHRLNSQFTQTQFHYRQEIDDLHSLISHIFTPQGSSKTASRHKNKLKA